MSSGRSTSSLIVPALRRALWRPYGATTSTTYHRRRLGPAYRAFADDASELVPSRPHAAARYRTREADVGRRRSLSSGSGDHGGSTTKGRIVDRVDLDADEAVNGDRVLLRTTARARAASAKIIDRNNYYGNALSSDEEGEEEEVSAPDGSSNTVPATDAPSATKTPNAAVAAVPPPQRHEHDSTHFVKGGVPCDPAPTPFALSEYGEESVYTLVLLRHGESQWNNENRYTGWVDVDLTERGVSEARDAGRLLGQNGIEVDHAFTSVLRRASFTTNMALNTARQHWVPVTKTWRLNERHYGALQGYNKDTAYRELGIDQELVMEMRRSFDTRPPLMTDDHEYWHGIDRRYARLSTEQLERSRGESLKDALERITPFFDSVIVPSLRAGNKCLVVSHANTLRTLIKHIDRISDEDIKGMSIPTGIPLLYRLDRDLRPVDPKSELEFRYMVEPKGYTWATSRAHGFHGVYLGDLERLQDIQRKRDSTNRDWQRIILRNLATSLDRETTTTATSGEDASGNTIVDADHAAASGVMETRQLWWQIHNKMKQQEFSNMLILSRMKDYLENLMYGKKQRFLTMEGFERIMNKIHLDTEGDVVEPFVELKEAADRKERVKKWYESMALDLEEDCLIK